MALVALVALMEEAQDDQVVGPLSLARTSMTSSDSRTSHSGVPLASYSAKIRSSLTLSARAMPLRPGSAICTKPRFVRPARLAWPRLPRSLSRSSSRPPLPPTGTRTLVTYQKNIKAIRLINADWNRYS